MNGVNVLGYGAGTVAGSNCLGIRAIWCAEIPLVRGKSGINSANLERNEFRGPIAIYSFFSRPERLVSLSV